MDIIVQLQIVDFQLKRRQKMQTHGAHREPDAKRRREVGSRQMRGEKLFSKETKRWLRAIGIAKILFEEEGYHCLYLEGIENFIRRKTMYSPKIREDLIPLIFRAARVKKIHMTTFVNRILEQALNGGDEFGANEIISNGKELGLSQENGRDHGEP